MYHRITTTITITANKSEDQPTRPLCAPQVNWRGEWRGRARLRSTTAGGQVRYPRQAHPPAARPFKLQQQVVSPGSHTLLSCTVYIFTKKLLYIIYVCACQGVEKCFRSMVLGDKLYAVWQLRSGCQGGAERGRKGGAGAECLQASPPFLPLSVNRVNKLLL